MIIPSCNANKDVAYYIFLYFLYSPITWYKLKNSEIAVFGYAVQVCWTHSMSSDVIS